MDNNFNVQDVDVVHACAETAGQKKEKRPPKSGIFMNSMNLMNVIIGAGIIALPVSFSNGGFGLSIVLTVISALISHFSTICIVKLLAVTGKRNLPDVLFNTTGIVGFTALSFCQILYPILILLSYSIVIADNFTQIFFHLTPTIDALHDRRVILAIAIFAIILPFSLFKNVHFLDKMSFVSIACVIFYFAVVVIRSATEPHLVYTFTGTFNYFNSGVAQALSVLAFSMCGQHCVASIYLSLKDRSVSRMMKSTHISVYLSVTIYLLIAICGYLCFGGRVNGMNLLYAIGNMLTDFCDDDLLVIIARILFALTIILSAPLHVVAAREGILTIIQKFIGFSWIAHVFVTIVIMFLCFAVGSKINDLGEVVAVAGALAGSPIGFVLPGIAFLFGMRMGYKPNNISKICTYFLIIYGSALTVLGVVMSLVDSGGAGARVRYWCTSNIDHTIATAANITIFQKVWSN